MEAVNGGTITLKDSTGTPGNKDISVWEKRYRNLYTKTLI